MGFAVFAFFLGLPLVEITVFIEVGDRIGVWWTLGLILLTAVAGTTLLRVQGMATLARVQQSLERDEAPVAELFDGLCILLAGVLLLTPGFVTDAAGLLLFVPPVRWLLMGWVWHWLQRRGGLGVWARRWTAGPEVIEGEYRVVRPEDDRDKLGGRRR